ncbi:NrfJ [hydrothermal vent metagenome]|uniref:NrfJ n=1 Tax=hydrothermal vent metagenome TaxID=652676 RepID=A0A3B0TXX6_9ZZZZ
MRLRLELLLISFIFITAACVKKTKQETKVNIAPIAHKILVEEVIQATSYTYVKAKEDGMVKWIAIPKREVEVGKTYYYNNALEMNNFESKDLKRTFKSIYFVQALTEQESPGVLNNNSPHNSKKTELKKKDLIAPVGGGLTIAGLYSDKDSYAGKIITLSAEVVKVNNGIMGKNWIHVQDGSGDLDSKNFDLTVTTKDTVKVGDKVTVTGKLALNKDFGVGYVYTVIVEDAKLSK